MTRPLRIDYDGAWHHVMNRGARRRRIYEDDKDRLRFLFLTGEASDRFEIEVHAYCLMDNHYHLLIRTRSANLSRAMRHINGVYTQRYNERHGIDGPLLRGRFKSVLVQDDNHLLQVSRYIHLNPIEAGLVSTPEAHRWSSYPSFVGAAPTPRWLHVGPTLARIGSRTGYRQFVAGGVDTETLEFYAKQRLSPVFGDCDFRQAQLEVGSEHPENAPDRARLGHRSLEEIETAIVHVLGVPRDQIWVSVRGQRNLARLMAIALGQEIGGASLKDLATHYGLGTYAGAASAIRRLKELQESDPETATLLRRVHGQLTGESRATNQQGAKQDLTPRGRGGPE